MLDQAQNARTSLAGTPAPAAAIAPAAPPINTARDAHTASPRPRLPLALWLLSTAAVVALLAWAFTSRHFRDHEGFFTGLVCLPLAISAALALLAASASSSWRTFGLRAAVALVGHAATLQLIDAGPLIHFQRYRPFRELLQGHYPLVLALLALQLVAVLLWLRPHIRPWTLALRRTLPLPAILAITVLASIVAAPLARDVPAYLIELLFAAALQLLNLLSLCLAIAATPHQALQAIQHRLRAWFPVGPDDDAAPAKPIPAFVFAAAAWVTLAAAALGYFAYERHPHVPDEVVYFYHARMLAAGHLTIPTPPAPEAFELYLMDAGADGSRWFATMPPGWPAVLAIGTALGVPWLVNPLLAGLNVILAWLLAKELYDRATARLAVLLLAASPWFVFMAINFMTHTFALTCMLAAAAGVAYARRWRKPWPALAAGAALGALSLVRPLEAMIVGALLGLWSIGVGARRLTLSALLCFGIGAAAVGALNIPYNSLLTGDPSKVPVMQYMNKVLGPGANALGFGPNRGANWALDPGPGHGLRDAAINTNLNTFSLNTELHGWSIGSLWLLALVVCCGPRRPNDRLMLAAILAVVAVHALYWYSGGPDFGPRYWYLAIVPAILLTARGAQVLSARLRDQSHAPASTLEPRVALAVLCLCVISLVAYFPWRAIDKYHHYLRMRPDVRGIAAEHHFGRSLVLVRGQQHPDYASAAAHNPIDFQAPVPVYAWDRSPAVRAAVLNAYPDRPVWLLDGPTITGGAYRVVAGPLTARELLAAPDPAAAAVVHASAAAESSSNETNAAH